MTDTITNISIFHQSGTPPASVSDVLIRDTSERSTVLLNAAKKLTAIAGGIEGGNVAIRVDSATGAAATGTIAFTQADLTAGDIIRVSVPGISTPFVFTAVASGPTARDGEFSIETSDTAVGDSFVAALVAMSGIRDYLTGVNTSGSVALTAKKAGTAPNGTVIAFTAASGTPFVVTQMSGGLGITSRPSMTVTFGTANITANDTFSIGGRKYTWKASASADGEITLSTTEATAATNFAAAINADATWTGLLSASRDTAVVTLSWLGDPRVGQHIVCDFVEANAGSVTLQGTLVATSAEAFVDSTTVTGSSATVSYNVGGVA